MRRCSTLRQASRRSRSRASARTTSSSFTAPPTALTRAIRDAGAYALQRLDSGTRASTARAVDAYLLSWQSRGVECLAAVIPRTHALARRDIGLADGGRDRRRDLAWASLVGEVTDGDRHETVGGAIHARPFVATR
jgi:hypothetical protein